ncbi:Retrovirus-related Pol polyprotein from transposon TNT 1-94 [Vitis vinifera]|uniref:Retrovirus-related Pol polyprotein from transposon TNT 1-94 n=1 Tax=Vitis vinifera TaxID=29760 RepID=A0A438HUG4_VITVI|nr:Retrovirus-related Pol polyprotein from transposon TNT 1-94 [Vitis vinifera]
MQPNPSKPLISPNIGSLRLCLKEGWEHRYSSVLGERRLYGVVPSQATPSNAVLTLRQGRHSSVVTGIVPDGVVGTVQVSLRHSSDAVQGPFRRHSDADEKRNLHALLRCFQTSELKTPFGVISVEDPVLASSPIGEVVWQHCAATRMLPALLKDWYMDLDYALRENRPPDLTSARTAEQRVVMEKWERSNRMSLMIMKHSILEAIKAIVPTDTWWIDTGATTHISVTMQGCLRSRMPIDGERYIYIGNGNKVAVKAIGLFRIVSEGILDLLDFSNFQVCIECIKGKQTNMRKKDTNRCSDVLELIHMDICGPFPTPWNGQQYFITFIDDYSRYGYLYLIHEKSQSLNVFKNFKAKVENQLSKKIKAVRSDRGSEYYGRYDGSGKQRPGPFAKYLMECGIVPQYTMTGTPSQNGVVERRNRTLKDMVRSMITHSTLP